MRLLPDAQRGALAFSLCRTQWMHGPGGEPTGLRYDDCISVLRLRAREYGIARSEIPDVFADLQVMEAAFVAAVHERMKAEAAARETHLTSPGSARHGRP